MSDGPKEVLSIMECKAGGILDATYPGQLPHNEQQISNFKHYVHDGTACSTKGNELYSIMLQAHFEHKDRKFIRDVKTYPEPAIVLVTDQQLFDIVVIQNSSQFSLLTSLSL